MEAFINEKEINELLNDKTDISETEFNEIITKAKLLKGLTLKDVNKLIKITNAEQIQTLFNTANYIKNTIYGNRLVLFAPLYISNICNNECLYCAFRHNNKIIKRTVLNNDEISEEVKTLINQGHKRILLVAGEAYPQEGLKYIYNAINLIYKTKTNKGEIRRINVNIAPLNIEEFKELNTYNIGTYQLFQETYHKQTYEKVHIIGNKANYHYRLSVMDRALQAGLHDIGIGVLFGLADWRYELLALLSHANYLDKTYDIGPHTISIPRIEPATNSEFSFTPPYAVNDDDFKKIIAILRIAVPYTGLILSTRENANIRREAFELGISQISAGSRTDPGGYNNNTNDNGQFSLGDTRPLLDVMKDIVDHNHIPSFCTACYRKGRVGKDFMELAKPGLIKEHCLPNSLFTFNEYLQDFADEELKQTGEKLIKHVLDNDIKNQKFIEIVKNDLNKINIGSRDILY